MNARDMILGSIRRSLGVNGREAPRRTTVADRLATHPRGVIPARGRLSPREQVDLFCTMVEASAGTVERLPDAGHVPTAICALLRGLNLPMRIRRGDDPRLAALPWDRERGLEVSTGPSDGQHLAAVSAAFGAVAESGTLVLISGPDNPTTLNFLPDTHVVLVEAKDVAGDYETVWDRLRAACGTGLLPRTVNMITGPSRSADIEHKLILGAHGPRRLHVIVTGDPAE